jgi:hypothetical protein
MLISSTHTQSDQLMDPPPHQAPFSLSLCIYVSGHISKSIRVAAHRLSGLAWAGITDEPTAKSGHNVPLAK